ncbi:hypothetical protein [Streptomyces sp. NPDC005423]|uniref:hypothetical protein n=1 Tax=Streptomyces sp. NPDC005423 TaxID=3155343 RepID=UPI0033A94871
MNGPATPYPPNRPRTADRLATTVHPGPESERRIPPLRATTTPRTTRPTLGTSPPLTPRRTPVPTPAHDTSRAIRERRSPR